MGYDILGQEQIFFYSCILGVALGILYDIFRIIRLGVKWNTWAVFMQDVLYFIICGISTFLFLLTFNNGVVRIYVICGEFMGWAIYYITVGEIVYRFSSGIVKFVKRIVKKVIFVILNPFLHILEKIKCKVHNKRIKNNKM